MQLKLYATKHSIAFTRVEIDALLNPIEENDGVELFTIEELGRSAAGVKCVSSEELEKDESL